MVMMGMSTMLAKVTSVFMGFSILFAPMAGFAMDDKLAEAYVKTKQVESCDSYGSMKLSVDVQSDEYDELMSDDANLPMFLQVLKDIKIDYKSTQFASDNNLKAKAYMDFDVAAGIFNIKLKTWMDVDLTNLDNPQMKIIVELPEMLKAMANIDKQYILLDYSRILNQDDVRTSLSSLMGENMDSLLKLNNLFDGLASDMEWNDAGNGMYTITLNNEQAMDLLVKAVELYVNSDYMQAIMPDEAKTEINTELGKIYGFLKTINLFTDEGMVFDAKVNEDGYIDYQNIKLNVQADLKDIAGKFKEAYPDSPDSAPDMKIGVAFEMDSNIQNINSANEIEFPVLTAANSLDVFSNFMTGSVHEVEPIVVFIDGEHMQFTDAKPELINDRTLVPARAIFEALKGEMGYSNADGREVVTGQLNGNSIELVIGENTAYVNGDAVELDVPAMINDYDRTMVPLRFVAENLGLTVDYEEIEDVLYIDIYSE